MAKKATKKAASKSNNGTREMVLVGSKVKAAIKAADCNTAGDALEGLNRLVHDMIEQAVARTKENSRKTVRSHDF